MHTWDQSHLAYLFEIWVFGLHEQTLHSRLTPVCYLRGEALHVLFPILSHESELYDSGGEKEEISAQR